MSDQKPRILLADDEPHIIKIVGKRLEIEGFEVIVAMNGEEALAKAAEHPALIILDMMMPKRSGLDVCATLRKDRRYDSIPIVFYTGKGDEDVLSRFGQDSGLLKQWGADAYVQKTEGTQVLVQRIRELLAKPRQPSA